MSGPDPKVPRLSTTVLHEAVIKNKPNELLLLGLQHRDLINAKVHSNDYNGSTPLHVAATLGNLECMKVLLQINADPNIEDGHSLSPRHLVSSDATRVDPIRDEMRYCLHISGATRCPRNLAQNPCGNGCSLTGIDDGTAPAPPSPVNRFGKLERNMTLTGGLPSPAQGLRVLCCDGGGIKGLAPLQMLLFIEKQFALKSGHSRGIHHYFDLFVGTSTGAIIAASLALGKSLIEIMGVYLEMKDVVFNRPKPTFDLSNLEMVLKKAFGEQTKMSDVGKKLMIAATEVKTENRQLAMFENITPHGISPAGICNQDEFVWQVVLRSASAPYFFEMGNSRFVDGGFVANNPVKQAHTKLFELKCDIGDKTMTLFEKAVVSFGTSRTDPKPSSAQDINGGPLSFWNFWSKITGNVGLAKMAANSATYPNDDVVKQSMVDYTISKVPFYRFNNYTAKEIELHTKDLEILRPFMWDAYRYIAQFPEQIVELYDNLKQ